MFNHFYNYKFEIQTVFKMSRVITLLLLICFSAELSYGMECSFGNKNFITAYLDSCPGPFQSEEKSFCCYDLEQNKAYCCDVVEFAAKSSWTLLIIIIVVVTVFSLIVSGISCLCCTCCPWYRQRHRGAVYGKVEGPGLVHVVQALPGVSVQVPHHTNTTYATSSAGMSQPPTYSEVVYEKQAPYNPNYASQTQQ